MAPKKKTAAISSTHKSLADLKNMTQGELQGELKSAREAQYVLIMKKELGELKQSHTLKSGRKYIAQISTCLTSAI